MPTQVGISAYHFQMKERYADEWWSFSRGGTQDGFSEIGQYLNARRGHLVRLGEPDERGNYADQRALLITNVIRSNDRRMYAGLILKGEAGIVREIRNFDNPEDDPQYRTSVNEGVLTPLYFRLHMEDERDFGVLLLQTFGIDGMKGYIERDMRNYFRDEVEEQRTIRITQLVDAQVLEAFAANGQLQDVIVINSGESNESRNAMQRHTFGGDTMGDSGDKITLRLHRARGWMPNVISQIMNSIRQGRDPRRLVNAPAVGDIDDVKAEIRVGGRTQTFSLLNPDDSPIRHTITNDVEIGSDGLPTWESLHREADNVWELVREIIDGGA